MPTEDILRKPIQESEPIIDLGGLVDVDSTHFLRLALLEGLLALLIGRQERILDREVLYRKKTQDRADLLFFFGQEVVALLVRVDGERVALGEKSVAQEKNRMQVSAR